MRFDSEKRNIRFRRCFIAALCLLSLAVFVDVDKTYYRTNTSANTPVSTGLTARPDETNTTVPSPINSNVAVVTACLGTSFERISVESRYLRL